MTSPRGASPRSPRGSSPAQSPRDSPRGDSPRGDSPRGASPRGRRQSARGRNSVHEDSPRWANRPRRRPCAGRSNSSLLADVVVKNDEIEALKESLQRGGGVVARKTVGEFLKGFRLAAGQDLKLEAFDITGLKDGEEVDPRLASVVQDSLAGSREDDRDIRLYARPPWYEPEDAVPLSRCQQFWSRWLPCLRKPKRWRRKRHLGEGLFGCYVRVQQALLRLVYRKSSAAKQRDIFVSFQEADRDLARWLRLFCDMRSLSAYAQLPNEAARKSLEKKPQEPQEPQNSRSSLRGSIRGSMRGSIRGSIRRSIASMSSVASQRTGDMDTGGPVEETAVPVEEQEVSLPQWLQDREELIRTSRVFLVITSQDSLENAAVLQDCIWAWQWGVPVLPVRRVGDNKLPKEVKKKLRFLHTLKMGLPEVGLGTNRKDFFFKVSSSLAAGIRMGRSRKRPKMPRHVWDFFFRAVKHLQRDSKDLQSTEASVSERPVLGLTTGEARFCIERGQLVDVPDLGRLEKPEKVKKEEGTGRHESKNQEELVAKDKTEQTELSAAMEDRTFGILTMLSLLGSQNFQVATKAAQVLRTITATERGAAAVALFGGVEVLLKLVAVAIEGSQEKKQASTKRNIFGRKAKDTPASPTSASPKSGRARDEVEQAKSARWGKETSPESARGPSSPRNRGAVGALDSPPESPRDSPKSARWRRGTSAQDSPPESPGRDSPRSARWQEDSPSQSPDSPKSARWRGVSPRDDASPRDASPRSPRARAEGPMSARGGRGGQESPREETDAKPNKLAKRRLPCLGRCRRRRHEEDVADEDDDEEDEEDGAGGGHHGHGKSGDSSNLFFRCADHGLAALRNLAAFSRERKEQILEKEGEKVTMEALRVCRGLTEAQQPARSASALLRNLSGGLRGAYALRGAGFLQIAEEELEDHRGGPGVRLHILAALQNMASCADASDNIFPQPQNWLELCALAARTAVEEGHFRTTKQALGAMANFAILRTAQEALQGHYCSDHGLPFAPFGHMLAAHPVEESSEEEAEQLDAADIKAKVESTTQESSGTSSDSDTAQESPDPGVQQSSKSHIADPEMEESLARASEKVPPEMIQSMLALIQVKALRPASGDVPSSLVSLASSAAAALANFAQDTDLERLLGSMGGIEMTIDALGLLDAEEFQLQAVRFLWNMTFSRANQQRFMDHDGLGKVLAAMQTFQKTHHSPLQEHGCGVLRNLAHGDARHKRALLRSGVIKAVCEALRKFYQEINVCTQAVFALTALCLGAPPAALQAKKYGALRWLVSALKLTGDNAEITELILQALEALLLVPQALTPFGRRKGHLEVLQVLDRFAEDTTVHMVFRTLAAALSHTNLKDMEMEKGEEPAPSGSEELWELMAKAPGTTIRNDLMDRGIIQKVIDALQKFEEYTIAIEAGAGVLMNVALEVKERDEDATNLQRKLDVGLACHKCLTIIGHLATSAEKMQSTGFVSNLFRLLAAVALHEEIALLLHRKQAASKALEYLKAYWDVPTVQASGCAFLSNLANSKLRIREAIVGVGTLEYLIDQLKGSKHQALIVQSMCKALKDLAPAEAAVQILRTYKLLDLVFEAADEHLEEPHVMEASLALLWTLSAIHRYAEELNRKGTTQRALQVLQRHRAHHEVCRCGAGLLRNLFAAPLSAKAADDCLASGGVRLLLEALWQHCLPPVQGTMSQAAYTMAKRGSMDSIGSSPGNGPKRAGSILEAGKAVPRAGSTLARDSQLEGANPRVTNRRNSVRRNSVRRVSDPDLSVKIFDLEAADRVTTEEKMAVAEQILAALKNLVAYSKLAAALAEEIYRSEEWDNLRMVVELYPKSIMVQYQGFELIGKLVTEKRELRAAFRAIADHVLLTNLNHRNTPVADVAELLLEALN